MSEEQKDVKQSQETSTENPAVPADTATAEGTKASESKEERTIPYVRFKEMVDTKKDLEKKIKGLEKLVEDKVQETAKNYTQYYEAELAKMNRQMQAADPYQVDTQQEHKAYDKDIGNISQQIEVMQKTIESLRNENETSKLQTQVVKLKQVYPALDEEHVYAVKKLRPDWSLEECAEYSHQKWDAEIKSRVDKVMNAKKEAARKPVMGAEGKIALKPEERPKTMKEAKKKMLEYMSQFDK